MKETENKRILLPLKEALKQEQKHLPAYYAFFADSKMPGNKPIHKKVFSQLYNTRLRSVYQHFKPISKIVDPSINE